MRSEKAGLSGFGFEKEQRLSEEPEFLEAALAADPESSSPPADSHDVPGGDQEATPWRALHPRYVELERLVSWTVTGLFLLLPATVTLTLAWSHGWLPMIWRGLATGAGVGAALLLAWTSQVYPQKAFERTRYRLSDFGLEIRKGVYWRKVLSLPRARVQHTDVREGPLQRRYEMATLVIHTAGTENASVELEGLPRDVAFEIRDQLLAGTADDAV